MAQTKIAGLFLDPTVISGLTALGSGGGAPAADYLFIWDATDSLLKKILPNHLGLAAAAHTIESHTATDATGANLDTLTGGSSTDADALHTHALKASLAAPALTGHATATTQAGTDDSTRIATTAHVKDVKIDDFAAGDDNADLDSSTSRHGLLLKLGGGTTNFLRADGAWAAAGVTVPLLLDQGDADTNILELQSSDVTHGLSGYDTNTYGLFRKKHGLSGMLDIWGFSDANANQAIGLSITGVCGVAANTAKTTSANGIIEILGGIKNGSAVANPGANGNIVVIRDAASGSAKLIVDQEGDTWQPGNITLGAGDRAHTQYGAIACIVTKSGNQTLPDTTETPITWNVSGEEGTDDGTASGGTGTMHSHTSNSERIYARTAGWYLVGATCALNTGYARMVLKHDGTWISNQRHGVSDVRFSSSAVDYFTAGTYFKVEMSQWSGGSKTIYASNARAWMIRIA